MEIELNVKEIFERADINITVVKATIYDNDAT